MLLAVAVVLAPEVNTLLFRLVSASTAPSPTTLRLQLRKFAAESAPYGARFGSSVSKNYRATFFEANPGLEGQVVVHHGVEQQVLTKFPGVVSESEIHSLENLRGIPNSINSDVHLSAIRIEWNRFYKPFIANGAQPTKIELLQKATEIDLKYGPQFSPPIGGK